MREINSLPKPWIMAAGGAAIVLSVVLMFFTWPSSNPVGAEEAEATPTPERQIWDHPGECGPSYVRDSSGECVPNAALESAIAEADVECPSGYEFTPYSQTVWCILIDENGEEEWIDHTLYDGPNKEEYWDQQHQEAMAQREMEQRAREYWYYLDDETMITVPVPDGVEVEIFEGTITCVIGGPPGCVQPPVFTLTKGDEILQLDSTGNVLTPEDNWARLNIDPNLRTFDFVPTLGEHAYPEDDDE